MKLTWLFALLLPVHAAWSQPRLLMPQVQHAAAPAAEWTVLRSQSSIELLPTLRVQAERSQGADGRRTLQVRRFSAQDANIGPNLHGVVFNHSMQAYGALTGEISFRLAADALPRAEAIAGSAGLGAVRRIGRSDYFVVRAAAPEQLRDALLRLRAHSGVLEADWVVNYNLPRKPIDAARSADR